MYSSFTFDIAPLLGLSTKKAPRLTVLSTPGVVRPRCLCARPRRRGTGKTLAVPAAGPQAPDREQPLGGVLHLEGRVLEAEAGVQQLLELAPHAVAVLVALDEHVSRERREVGADLPHVQVVQAGDARVA